MLPLPPDPLASAAAPPVSAEAYGKPKSLKPGQKFQECRHCPEMVVLPAGQGVVALDGVIVRT
jgi:hypothetical protein